MFLGLLIPPEAMPRYLKGFFWAVFGLCTARTCFYGLGTALSVWLHRLVASTLKRLHDERISESNQWDLSFWGWTVMQFSNLF